MKKGCMKYRGDPVVNTFLIIKISALRGLISTVAFHHWYTVPKVLV